MSVSISSVTGTELKMGGVDTTVKISGSVSAYYLVIGTYGANQVFYEVSAKGTSPSITKNVDAMLFGSGIKAASSVTAEYIAYRLTNDKKGVVETSAKKKVTYTLNESFSPQILGDLVFAEKNNAVANAFPGCFLQGKSEIEVNTSGLDTHDAIVLAYAVMSQNGAHWTAKIGTRDIALTTKRTYMDDTESQRGYKGAASFAPAQSGSLAVSQTIQDSRKFSDTRSQSNIMIYPYTNARIDTATAERCNADGTINPDGNYCKVTVKGFAQSVKNGTERNTATLKVDVKNRATGVVQTKTYQIGALNDFAQVTEVFTASSDNSHIITVTLSDKLASVEREEVLSTAQPIMDFKGNGKGLALGGVASRDGVDCQWPLYTKEILLYEPTGAKPLKAIAYETADPIVAIGNDGNYDWVKYDSGKYEAYGVFSHAATYTKTGSFYYAAKTLPVPTVNLQLETGYASFPNSPNTLFAVRVDGTAANAPRVIAYKTTEPSSTNTYNVTLFGKWK